MGEPRVRALRVVVVGDTPPIAEAVRVAGHALVGVAVRPSVPASPGTGLLPGLRLAGEVRSRALELRGAVRARATSLARRFDPSDAGAAADASVARVVTGDASSPRFLARVRELAPDVLLCAGWPRRLPSELLAVARVAAVNFHMALLPRHRGPDPLTWTLLAGDADGGVTFHRMDGAFDEGPILLQSGFPIGPEDTRSSVQARAMARGVSLVPALLDGLAASTLESRAQDPRGATWAPRPTPADLRVAFVDPARVIACRIRARSSGGVVVAWQRGPFGARAHARIHFAADLATMSIAASTSAAAAPPPGTVVGVAPNLARVTTGDGTVLLATRQDAFSRLSLGTRLEALA